MAMLLKVLCIPSTCVLLYVIIWCGMREDGCGVRREEGCGMRKEDGCGVKREDGCGVKREDGCGVRRDDRCGEDGRRVWWEG